MEPKDPAMKIPTDAAVNAVQFVMHCVKNKPVHRLIIEGGALVQMLEIDRLVRAANDGDTDE